MSLPRVVAVAPGSPAERAGIRPEDEILAVNGEAPRDVIRWRLLTDAADLDIDLRRGGLEQTLRLSKREGEPLGAEVSSAVFDRVRTCDNHCPFCFIYQLPKGMRSSLYMKDDDYRLSFLYGNFTTLTRFTEADLERVLDEGLGPLYVSIHATDPDLRSRLLRNPRGATSLRWLRLLLEAGVEVHGQVVVCPGVNDGDALHQTLAGIMDLYPRLATVGLVPLGVSDYNHEPDMRAHTPGEAEAVLDTVEVWQARFSSALGRRMVFAADEYYLMAGRPFPPASAYEGFAQHENGIGMAVTFTGEVLDGPAPAPASVRGGFFAWVDGAPADGYRAPRSGRVPLAVADREAPEVALLTGEYGAAVLEPLLARLGEVAGVPVRALAVPNRFFGGNTAVTGLMTGADVAATLEKEPGTGVRYLLPDVCLSRGVFLDGASPQDLPRPVEVVPTDGRSLVEQIAPRPAPAPVALTARRSG